MPKKTSPAEIVRAAVARWVSEAAVNRLVFDPTSNIVSLGDAAEKAHEALIDEASHAGAAMSRQEAEAISVQLLDSLTGQDRILFGKFTDACAQHEDLARDAGYLLGVEVGRRVLGGGR